jgi:hypothetical protein
VKRLVIAGLSATAIALALPAPAQSNPSWTMPNLVGTDLQGAQDTIQSVTHGKVWLSSSTHLTGQGRAQTAAQC